MSLVAWLKQLVKRDRQTTTPSTTRAAGKTTLRCPKCNSALSVSRDRIGDGADAEGMAMFGVEQVRLRCRGCRSVMDVTLGVGQPYE